jgi:hypothetical protein
MADARTNSLIVTAEAADMKSVKALVASLDVAVPQQGKAAPSRGAVRFELVLLMIHAGSEASLGLPRTTTGAIDAADPNLVLSKLRDGVSKSAVTELVKVSMTADDGRPWLSRQTVQIPLPGAPGGPAFAGYTDARMELGVNPQGGKDGTRHLGINCRIDQFSDAGKPETGEPASRMPPSKESSNLEFSTPADDGKLSMAAIEARFGGSYVLFVRVTG